MRPCVCSSQDLRTAVVLHSGTAYNAARRRDTPLLFAAKCFGLSIFATLTMLPPWRVVDGAASGRILWAAFTLIWRVAVPNRVMRKSRALREISLALSTIKHANDVLLPPEYRCVAIKG